MEYPTYGLLHCHSTHSIMDSTLKISDMVARAKEMGVKALSLTDHGTCTGLIEFYNACTDAGIRPILGVEAYVENPYSGVCHLVLLARNYQGYQEISRAITDGYKNYKTVGRITNPILTKEMLAKHFRNGNVIATTACVSGVAASILLSGQDNVKQIGKLEKKMEKYEDPDSPKHAETFRQFHEIDEQIEKMIERRNIIHPLAEKKYKKRLRGLKSMEAAAVTEEEKKNCKEMREMLEREINETQNAYYELVDLKKELAQCRRKRTLIKQKCTALSEDGTKRKELSEKIDALREQIKTHDELMDCAREELLWYKNLFGPYFYIELQNHGFCDEEKVMGDLVKLAKELDIPLSASNDSHMAKREDAFARATLRSLRFEIWEPVTPVDEEMYMKTDMELYDAIRSLVGDEAAGEAIRNVRTICDSCEVVFPKESHYPKYLDSDGKPVKDPGQALREAAMKNIPLRYPDGFPYMDRLEYELSVITELGYAEYTLIVADFINYAKNLAMTNNDMKIGYGVGPGRGSGAGSIVNYLTGITNIDPMKYDLIFERYLNKDRVSMPDIDTDFSEGVRDDAIQYVREKYGDDAVAGIRTVITEGAKASIRDAARTLVIESCPDWKKSTPEAEKQGKRRTYLLTLGDEIRKSVPDVPDITLADCVENLAKQYPDKVSHEILKRAQMLEGSILGTSVHAAGIIITDGTPVSDFSPLLYNPSKHSWAVQCDMVEAESALHLLKMDFLGLKNLDVISETLRRIKKNTGRSIDPNNLPFEESVFKNIFSEGKTDCVFQFESGGMKQMLKDFRPECIEDIILLVAAYRPGPKEFIPDIINVKHKRTKPHYIVPELEEILGPTYGKPIYQEQIMDIFHKCAGFSLGEADIIRRYMSKKKTAAFLKYQPKFIEGMVAHGASEKDAEEFWDSLVDFAKYAFNKSHAAAYAIVAYQTAWLKHHFPVEYMCSVLNRAEAKKLPALLYECRELGIKVVPPDINKCFCDFEDSEGAILYGLNGIKGVKRGAEPVVQERMENGYYRSFHDFLLRAHQNRGITEKYIASGAFDSITNGQRKALLQILPACVDSLSKIDTARKNVRELTAAAESGGKDEKKKLENARATLARRIDLLKEINIPRSVTDDVLERLKEEKEILGAYISGHPLDAFTHIYQRKDITLIKDFRLGSGKYAGIITNLRKANRKSDGKEMAFFDIEDISGSISVNCFTNVFERYGEYVREDTVVVISGRGIEEEGYGDEGMVQKIVAKSISPCTPRRRPIFLSAFNVAAFEEKIRPMLGPFLMEGGHPIVFHDSTTGNITETDITCSADILELDIPGTYIAFLDYNMRPIH